MVSVVAWVLQLDAGIGRTCLWSGFLSHCSVMPNETEVPIEVYPTAIAFTGLSLMDSLTSNKKQLYTVTYALAEWSVS